MDRFQDLMNRYLQQSLSPEERLEFFQLLADRKDVHLPDELVKRMAKEEDADRMLRGSYDDNYARIRSALDLKPEGEPVSSDTSSQDEPDTVPFHRSRYWYARAAAIIVIAMAAGVLFLSKRVKLFDPFSTEQQIKLARFQGMQIVDLPDGSKITLNANSEVNYNRMAFGETTREVTLIGEATFDVAHDPTKPFIVHTGNVSTKVLGTEFNISAYPGQEKITVTVLRGLVEVGDEKRVYGQIRPNEQIAVDVRSNQFVQVTADAEEAVQWKQNFLILDNVDLAQAAAIIGKKFNVRISLENPAMNKCRIKVRFLNDEDLEKVLDVISRTLEITYSIEKDRSVVLKGNGCN